MIGISRETAETARDLLSEMKGLDPLLGLDAHSARWVGKDFVPDCKTKPCPLCKTLGELVDKVGPVGTQAKEERSRVSVSDLSPCWVCGRPEEKHDAADYDKEGCCKRRRND